MGGADREGEGAGAGEGRGEGRGEGDGNHVCIFITVLMEFERFYGACKLTGRTYDLLQY